ncbi:MAG: ABC transporter substrate-binding protein [Desulfobacterales bacterium]|nr:ABC transporter substrate-binding protein [Desulfobacterales bacterium]
MSVWATRLKICIAIWIVTFLGVAAAGQQPPSGQDVSAQGHVLKMGVNISAFDTLDPHFAASFADRMLADMVFGGLIRYRPGLAPELEPDLAVDIPEPVTVNGKQTWTFHLRPGVYFHDVGDGVDREMTAEDVVASFEKTMNPSRSAYAGGYAGISIDALDNRTVRFTVDPPQSPLLFLPKVANYAGGFVVAEIAAQDGGTRLLGTGPFAIRGQTGPTTFFLDRHPAYFRGTPELKGVEIHFLPETETRLAAFERALDLICGESSAKWVGDLRDKKDIIIDSFGVPETACIYFNTLYQAFADARVRKAVAYALNRDLFLEPFGREMARNVFTPAPPYMPGGLSQDEVKALNLDYPRDIDRAKGLLAAAGYAEGFAFNVVVSELIQIKKNYQTLKHQLARIGIRMNISVTDHATYHKMIRMNANPIVIYEAFRPNTDELLSRFFHSESKVMTGKKMATNFSNYTGIDDLIEQARSERVTTTQIKLWEYAQIKLLEDMVVYPLHYRKHTYVRKPYLDYGHPLRDAIALYPQITEKTRLTSDVHRFVPGRDRL